ncbi:MAG: Ig-like domain-containing protein [Candidatus Sericytochromatia bacterium]|nr:Ig-like domain-containing protein [Candidatus Sericytochromatia bacterium]
MSKVSYAALLMAAALSSACTGFITMTPPPITVGATQATTGAPATPGTAPAIAPAPAAPSAEAPVGSSPASGKQVREVRVTPESYIITAGEARDLLATVQFSDGTFDSNVTWASSDSRILEVNPTTGRISGKSEGVASIVASALGDPSKRALVTVTVRKGVVQEAVTRVDPASTSLAVGETRQLTGSVQMSDGSMSPNVRWESSNQSVAVVSGGGLVTAVGKGRATITVSAAGDSTRRATCDVTVQ